MRCSEPKQPLRLGKVYRPACAAAVHVAEHALRISVALLCSKHKLTTPDLSVLTRVTHGVPCNQSPRLRRAPRGVENTDLSLSRGGPVFTKSRPKRPRADGGGTSSGQHGRAYDTSLKIRGPANLAEAWSAQRTCQPAAAARRSQARRRACPAYDRPTPGRTCKPWCAPAATRATARPRQRPLGRAHTRATGHGGESRRPAARSMAGRRPWMTRAHDRHVTLKYLPQPASQPRASQRRRTLCMNG